jgi:ribonuclease HI
LIKIYTDGACKGNPGPGAYAAILQYKGHQKVLVQGFRKTTNNRMELMAVIAGLEALKLDHQQVDIYSDSKYVVDAVEKGWLQKWLKNGFKDRKNQDLWEKFYMFYQNHRVKLHWIKGHNGHSLNEKCDKLAVNHICRGPLFIDEGYELQIEGKFISQEGYGSF